METSTAPDAPEGIPLSPETDPMIIYGFLGRLFFKQDFDAGRAERVLRARGRKRQRRVLRCGEEWLALRVESQGEGFHAYQAVGKDGDVVAKVVVSDAHGGLMVAEEVQADYGREAVVASVFRDVRKDALRVGAEFWPTPPGLISDLEVRAWWEMDRMAVAYYPECRRLGLRLEGEEAGELDYLRHYVSAVRLKIERERMTKEMGAERLTFIEKVGVMLHQAGESGCKNAGDMTRWLNARGVKTVSGKGWSEQLVRVIARQYQRATGLRVLRWSK